MPRSYQAPSTSPEELGRRIDQQFEDPAFAFLRMELLTVLRNHEDAVRLGASPAFEAIETLLTRYESLLPSRPGDRFALDSWIIQDLLESWSTGPVKLPHTILPLYGNEWMWQRLPWIEQADRSGHRIYAITLKGREQLSSVRLLDYPWLCHELGHGLFTKCPTEVLEEYANAVEQHCKPLLRKTFADSSDVRALTKGHIARLRQCWLPRGDQQSWIHELAVDIVALWSCGPAFLAAMTDATDSLQLDPFVIESAHPPYALRILTLAEGAKALGWEEEATPLVEMSGRWESRKAVLPNYNHFVALTPRELTEEALRWTLRACRTWNIPRCNRETLQTIADRRRKKLPVDSAVELIASAALLFEQDPQAYPAWESTTVRLLCSELNGNTRDSIGPR